jgi:hypothetical protein
MNEISHSTVSAYTVYETLHTIRSRYFLS